MRLLRRRCAVTTSWNTLNSLVSEVTFPYMHFSQVTAMWLFPQGTCCLHSVFEQRYLALTEQHYLALTSRR